MDIDIVADETRRHATENDVLAPSQLAADAAAAIATGAKFLLMAWFEKNEQTDPERAAYVDALVQRGAQIEVRCCGGLHGIPHEIVVYLLTSRDGRLVESKLFSVPQAQRAAIS